MTDKTNDTPEKKSAKGRFFALVSYCKSSEALIQILQTKQKSVRAYALIKHDKDEADPHHHIVIRTNSTWTCQQLAKWFTNAGGEGQNTFCQLVRDREGIVDYLTHEGNEGEKYHYDKSDIIDGGLDDILPAGEASDDSAEILEKYLSGVSVREMVRLYGRDFLYHIASYAAVADIIRKEEGLL